MAIETELEVLKSVVNKLDVSLEKITEVSNSIGKLLAVHDQRIDNLERISIRRDDEIDDVHSRITTQTKEILAKIDGVTTRIDERMNEAAKTTAAQHAAIKDDINNNIKDLEVRIDALEKWKWYIIGAGAVIGYIISFIMPILVK